MVDQTTQIRFICLWTFSFANVDTRKVFVKKIENLFCIPLMILHIDLSTKFIANKIETEERFFVLKVFCQSPIRKVMYWSSGPAKINFMVRILCQESSLEHIPLTLSNWSLLQVTIFYMYFSLSYWEVKTSFHR